jgi:ATP adenylyltransferase
MCRVKSLKKLSRRQKKKKKKRTDTISIKQGPRRETFSKNRLITKSSWITLQRKFYRINLLYSGLVKNKDRKMEKLWAPWRLEYIQKAEHDTQGCIFCLTPKEARDEDNLIVYRSNLSFVIMNKYPYNNGHVMIVPYMHESDLTRLSDEILLDIQHLIQLSIRALNQTMNPHGINIGVNLGRSGGAGIIDHLHYHLVPRWNGDTNFMPVLAGTKVISEALSETWCKLHSTFKILTKD